MKTTFSLSAVFVLCLMFAGVAQGQSLAGYNTGIGFRGGLASGLSVKHFLNEEAALEGILTSNFRYGGATITVLYEKHAHAFNLDKLHWYYGFGGHVGRHPGADYYINHRNRSRYIGQRVLGIGIDGALGLEYYIGDIPFTIGADLKPYVNLNGGGGNWDSALIVRYVF